ncbi:O-acetyltransferase OatA [Rubripirellula lacrimiformis]|uniref:O-acetyltransferase OatA n=2 Tax=Rubripirellula lacrimiformis TaxID=1930273 RepID=A0A517N8M2_9BACT|nr:O-acetyltransferase OatA [Rubripirellula lacrimiformis]
MAAHFAGGASFLVSRLGLPGVQLFFALSGFLITGILLDCKRLSKSQSNLATLGRFYIRRALRIFPLYYLGIIVFAGFLTPNLRSNLVWFLTYTVNIGKAFGSENWAPLNHFWTLAVEEQFYIAWPWIVLLCSITVIKRVSYVLILLGIITRLAIYFAGGSLTAIQQLTPCCFEPLALGALFAIWKSDTQNIDRLKRNARGCLWLGLAMSAALFAGASWTVLGVLAPIAYAMLFAPMIFLVAINSGSPSLKLLRLPAVTYLGRISYGIYVWHLPVLGGFYSLNIDLNAWVPSPWHAILRTLLLTLLTILLSSLSWILFEKPINSLKRHYPYRVSEA